LNVGAVAFSCCASLRNAIVGAGVTNLGYYAFECSPLTNVVMRGIPASVLDLDGVDYVSLCHVFDASGYSVSIAPGVTDIRERAFENCTGMTTLALPEGVTNIGMWAFAFCSSLSRMPIPASVITISANAFVGCSGLEAFCVAGNNADFSSLEGVLFNKNQTTLILCPTKKSGIFTVPASVTAIDDCAFCECSLLSGLYFKGAMPSISDNAFSGATQLVVYYAGQANGWGASFGGSSAVSWNPQAKAGSTFGVVDGNFGFDIVNEGSPVVVVEACDNIAEGVWTSVATNTLTGGSSRFEDSDSAKHASRFYRFAMP
jgi:hypothetical protein